MKAFGFEITFAEIEGLLNSWISKLVLLGVFVLCAIMAFAPESIVERLQLAPLRGKLGIWLGLLLIFSCVFLLASLIRGIIIRYCLSRLFKGKDADERIKRLSPVAFGYLCAMYLRPDHAGRFDFENPSFQALRDEKMIRVALMGDIFEYPCYLQPWVVRWLDDHQDIVSDYMKQVR